MELSDAINALRLVEEHYEIATSKDIARLVGSNPFLDALLKFVIQSVAVEIIEELNLRLPAPKSYLLDYEEAARLLGRTVVAVRKMKDRGQIKAAEHSFKGRIYFTEDAVKEALLGCESRSEESKRDRTERLRNRTRTD